MPELEISRVHDAYADPGECPLCGLLDAAERRYLDSFLGARAMAPEARVLTNAKGFCPAHALRLYRGHNPLGLAVVTHTHLAAQRPALEAAFARVRSPGRRRAAHDSIGDLDGLLRDLRDRCQVCDMLAADLGRWAYTIVYLWRRDAQFPDRLAASRGFCLEHLRAVLLAAGGELGAADLGRFLDLVLTQAAAKLRRLEDEVGTFTQLFQHTEAGLGTEEQRTALARALQTLAGRLMRKE